MLEEVVFAGGRALPLMDEGERTKQMKAAMAILFVTCPEECMKASYGFVVSVVLLVTLGSPVLAHVTNPADPGVKRPSALDPKRPLNAELQTSVGEGFTLTAVGDLIMSRPLSQYATRESRVK
ncbi:MAG TPA: hypothetical protein VN860_06760, partial [Candidatus Acidoferrales bacterium]|nr:hypothetical protein [Candidatus Acidoferrales bacterium]